MTVAFPDCRSQSCRPDHRQHESFRNKDGLDVKVNLVVA